VLIGLGIGILLTPPTLLLAFLSAGGGHGDYVWAKLFFPYTLMPSVLTDTPISLWLVALAFVQFPVYGVLLGASASSLRRAAVAAIVIGIAHAAAVVLCLSIASKYFS
jgi:hypothetical protein